MIDIREKILALDDPQAFGIAAQPASAYLGMGLDHCGSAAELRDCVQTWIRSHTGLAKSAEWRPAVRTALLTTISSEDDGPDIVEMVVVQGANIGFTNAVGHTLLSVTLMRGRGDVISIMYSVTQQSGQSLKSDRPHLQ